MFQFVVHACALKVGGVYFGNATLGLRGIVIMHCRLDLIIVGALLPCFYYTEWVKKKKKSALVTRAPFCEILNSFWKLTSWCKYYINRLHVYKKIKLTGVLLNLLHHFYSGIQCDKTRNFVHGKAFEVHHAMPILGVELKRHKVYYTIVQFPSNFLSLSPKLCFWPLCKSLQIIESKMLIYRVF